MTQTAREQILANISKALGRDDAPTFSNNMSGVEIQQKFDTLVQCSPASAITPLNSSLLEHFTLQAKASNAEVVEFSDQDALLDYLTAHYSALDTPIYTEPMADINLPKWPDTSRLNFTDDFTMTNQFGLLPALGGIAETGSVVLASNSKHATAAGFLLDTMMVIISAKSIVEKLEQISEICPSPAHKSQENPSPTLANRCINIITGPSRTADVEQQVQLGAHGPRKLIIGIML